MRLRIGISPCPNDTFIFEAIYNKHIDLGGLEFDFVFRDVESLNQNADKGELDVCKLSFHALAHLSQSFFCLDAGAALGRACGPLLIAKEEQNPQNLSSAQSIYIPGEWTTANFLLHFALGPKTPTEVCLFSEIENRVLESENDLGVIIHENRFTYQEKGLMKLIDLGQHWENETKLPIPLGCIAVRRGLPVEVALQVQELIVKSIGYAYEHNSENSAFVQDHAQEMNADVLKKHISLYVNDYSMALGTEGRQAVLHLFEYIKKWKVDIETREDLFLPQ